jgi:hypothetical protein
MAQPAPPTDFPSTIIINAGVVDHDFEALIFLLFLRGSLLRCLDGEL